MNQRIDDLMYQAGLTAQGCLDKMDDYDREAILKFAELIIRECATVGFDAVANGDLVEDSILEHFGVEK